MIAPLTVTECHPARRFSEIRFSPSGKQLLFLVKQKPWLYDFANRETTILDALGPWHGNLLEGGGSYGFGANNLFFVKPKETGLYRYHLKEKRAYCMTPYGLHADPQPAHDDSCVLSIARSAAGEALVVTDLHGNTAQLHDEFDFYAQPCLHPSGLAAFIGWHAGNRMWQDAQVVLAQLTTTPQAKFVNPIAIRTKGQPRQLLFSEDGSLLILAEGETHGYLTYFNSAEKNSRSWQLPAPAGYPLTRHGLRTFCCLGDNAFVIVSEQGKDRCWQQNIKTGQGSWPSISPPLQGIQEIIAQPKTKAFAVIGSSPTTPEGIHCHQGAGQSHLTVATNQQKFNAFPYREPEIVSFPLPDSSHAHGWLYQPREVSLGESPVIMLCHNGPAAVVTGKWPEKALYYTSRGYTVFYLNYQGSSHHGLHYRDALEGRWGSWDVTNALAAKSYLCNAFGFDAGRFFIWGGGAGGFTVLRTLSNHPGTFRGGIAVYPVLDLNTWARQLSPYKQSYPWTLAGSGKDPSPLLCKAKITDPLALFYGKNDLAMSELMATYLSKLYDDGTEVTTYAYDEGSRFTKEQTMSHYYEQVEVFMKTQLAD